MMKHKENKGNRKNSADKISGIRSVPSINPRLDLTSTPCSQNTSKVLLKLCVMSDQDQLELLLNQGDAYENVLHSLQDENITILEDEEYLSDTSFFSGNRDVSESELTALSELKSLDNQQKIRRVLIQKNSGN